MQTEGLRSGLKQLISWTPLALQLHYDILYLRLNSVLCVMDDIQLDLSYSISYSYTMICNWFSSCCYMTHEWPGDCLKINNEILTHWGRVTHICVSKLTIIGLDNGLSSSQRQAIIWTNARILLIQTLGTDFSEISSEIHTFSFKKMYLKMLSAKCEILSQPQCVKPKSAKIFTSVWNTYISVFMQDIFCEISNMYNDNILYTNHNF